MFLCKRNNKILLKKSNLFLCKVKKEWFYQEKIISVFRKKKRKKKHFEMGFTFMK